MSEAAKSILVVDDNEDIRSLLSIVLEKEGFLVFLAANGTEALEIRAKNHLDLILLDIMMPGMSGLEVLKTIREDKKNNEIPIIMITAKSTIADIDEAVELGATSYIIKPFRPANLIEKVNATLAEEQE